MLSSGAAAGTLIWLWLSFGAALRFAIPCSPRFSSRTLASARPRAKRRLPRLPRRFAFMLGGGENRLRLEEHGRNFLGKGLRTRGRGGMAGAGRRSAERHALRRAQGQDL